MEVLSLLPKRAESLKEIQKVLDLPELKIVKPSDTRWLAHERCVKAVKASYSSIVLALEIYLKHHMNQKLLDLVKSILVTPQQQQCTYLSMFFQECQSLAVPYRPSTWTSPLFLV